jgi:FtsP/CotA-like multicopper oxidase with cupredoxin domain
MRRLSLALAATTALIPLPAFAGEYALVIEERTINITGKWVKKITVNGTIPGPALRFKEGEDVVVRVTTG